MNVSPRCKVKWCNGKYADQRPRHRERRDGTDHPVRRTTRPVAPAARDRNGYRQYEEEAVSRLRFVRSAQTAALTLTEIGNIITVCQAGTAPCEHVSTLLDTKLEDVHRRQQELALLEKELHQLISASQNLDPADCAEGSVCHIITRPPG